jgi:hypothetical protein
LLLNLGLLGSLMRVLALTGRDRIGLAVAAAL